MNSKETLRQGRFGRKPAQLIFNYTTKRKSMLYTKPPNRNLTGYVPDLEFTILGVMSRILLHIPGWICQAKRV